VIRPTGHRILIQPDEQPEQTGAILLPQQREFVATSGMVVAIGPRGSRVRWEARQRALQEAVSVIKHTREHFSGDDWELVREITADVLLLIGTPDPEHEIKVGDRVAFDYESGLRLTENGVEFLIMDEDDVVVIVEEAEAVA
jgi:co-chaperonin GroES (HSP10)